MELYLQEIKNNLANYDKNITVVLGNESCDLDSVVSTIVYSYLVFRVNKYVGRIVPVLNVDREDLALRTEVVYFLNKTGISLENLICKDEIDLQKLKSVRRLRLILVDHNFLCDEQLNLKNNIIQIIDHHIIQDPREISKCESKIEYVGSCCTLIAEEILKHPEIISPNIALLLYGTILLDTVNLQDTAKRVTEKDKTVANLLENYLEVRTDDLFSNLQKAKLDVSSLTPAQLLRKDTKFLSCKMASIAVASIPIPLEKLFEQTEFLSALSEMCTKRNLSFIVVMGSEISECGSSIKRQIAIFDESRNFLNKVSEYLLKLENPSLQLKSIPSNNEFFLIFDQENFALSRKFVLPAIQKYLESLESDCPTN